jgi:hypothetical protein
MRGLFKMFIAAAAVCWIAPDVNQSPASVRKELKSFLATRPESMDALRRGKWDDASEFEGVRHCCSIPTRRV